MLVKELKEKLSTMPDDMEIGIYVPDLERPGDVLMCNFGGEIKEVVFMDESKISLEADPYVLIELNPRENHSRFFEQREKKENCSCCW